MKIELTKSFEGCSLVAYPDPGTNAEPYTIGYGHTKGVKRGDTCTQAQADAWLLEDLKFSIDAVRSAVKVSLSENEESALVDLVFNIGAGNFAKSTLLKKLNLSDRLGASKEFIKWNMASGQVMNGLTRRRVAEADLFVKVSS